MGIFKQLFGRKVHDQAARPLPAIHCKVVEEKIQRPVPADRWKISDKKARQPPSAAVFLLRVGACVSLSLPGCDSVESGPSSSAEEKENLRHYYRSAKHEAEATLLRNAIIQTEKAPSQVEIGRLLALKVQALAEVRTVRDEVLETLLPGMSAPFRRLYERSLELAHRSLEFGDREADAESSRLQGEWVDWTIPSKTSSGRPDATSINIWNCSSKGSHHKRRSFVL